jgi:lipopolysaccharide export system protein LptA
MKKNKSQVERSRDLNEKKIKVRSSEVETLMKKNKIHFSTSLEVTENKNHN